MKFKWGTAFLAGILVSCSIACFILIPFPFNLIGIGFYGSVYALIYRQVKGEKKNER